MDIQWSCPRHVAEHLSRQDDSLCCRRGCTYRVVDGVPRFVQESSYADAFGHQWSQFRLTQLDSFTGLPISRRRLLSALGPEIASGLSSFRVLEAGCGAGRFTEVLISEGAQVTSFDLSSAVDAHAQNVKSDGRHVLFQGDLFSLPLSPNQFDLVMALGVIQHTCDPARAIRSLWSHVRPGGWLVVDQYAAGAVHRVRAKRIYRQILKHLPPPAALRCTNWLFDVWSPIHKNATSPRARQLLTLISPIVYFADELPELSVRHRTAWGRLDTYDSLTDWYAFRTTKEALRTLGECLQPSALDVEPCDNGWLLRAKKSTGLLDAPI